MPTPGMFPGAESIDMMKLLPIIMDQQRSQQAAGMLGQQGLPAPDPAEIQQMLAPPEQQMLPLPLQQVAPNIQGQAARQKSGQTQEPAPQEGETPKDEEGDMKTKALLAALGAYQGAESDTAPARASAGQPRGVTPSAPAVNELFATIGPQPVQRQPVQGFGQFIMGG